MIIINYNFFIIFVNTILKMPRKGIPRKPVSVPQVKPVQEEVQPKHVQDDAQPVQDDGQPEPVSEEILDPQSVQDDGQEIDDQEYDQVEEDANVVIMADVSEYLISRIIEEAIFTAFEDKKDPEKFFTLVEKRNKNISDELQNNFTEIRHAFPGDDLDKTSKIIEDAFDKCVQILSKYKKLSRIPQKN